ncbi:MAG: hypothetical protein KBF21_01230 [Thermoanaerobaculia bacterium]|nr:hypothetical protein [Thermoanaerobaculia bacterium]
MTGRRALRTLTLAGLLLPAAARAVPASAVSPDAGALAVRTPGWVLPSRPLEVTLEQRGVLSGRRITVFLFIDGNQLERVATTADRTRTRMPAADLAPGRHVLSARSGREVAQCEFRVIPWSWLAGAGAGLLLVLAGGGLAFARARGARRRRALAVSN